MAAALFVATKSIRKLTKELEREKDRAKVYHDGYHRDCGVNSIIPIILGSSEERLPKALLEIVDEVMPGSFRIVVKLQESGPILLETGVGELMFPARFHLEYEDQEKYAWAIFDSAEKPNEEQEVRLRTILVSTLRWAVGHYGARTDVLTGLNNRRVFDEKIKKEIDRADRFSHDLSLAVIDVDRFKGINDTYGHQVGDKTLRKIAHVLATKTRRVDTVARYGGDEFVVLLPETTKENAVKEAGNFCRAIRSVEFVVDGEIIHLTVTIGVATYPADASNSEELFLKADNACKLAKKRGKDKVRGAPSLEKIGVNDINSG